MSPYLRKLCYVNRCRAIEALRTAEGFYGLFIASIHWATAWHEIQSVTAQHFRQLRKARFKAEWTVDLLSKEGDERCVDQCDEDRPGPESVKASGQNQGQGSGQNQHDDIVDQFDSVDIQLEAVGDFTDKKL